ncbi:MAG: PilX N-terminal domain-containing pilus assembly protein [Gammaproteobacteria bacterium]|nr:PilX N-terminal domain-containing pilus assembly protein [Gammaproteobacteria bacterium]MDH4316129.1 PilX N-terminal domain-containing pilus assembly protein [Gammaproteobacteria bacterium]MDH5214948.1 PilX N-terminal domain-containing pilus assembly protein [Gammaproteobacteria bacterium]MDH5502075.1 PilX N-terminal domain-containing pilus assembly protein [Gammaproteobacteria bacterium]
MTQIKLRKRQDGAALIVGLMLLVVITILAVSGMNTATTELAMARNAQNYENAFQAAETGLERALSQGRFNTLANTDLGQYVVDAYGHEEVHAVIAFEDSTLVPDRAFSLGVGSGIAAYHFNATATAESNRSVGGTTDRDASAVHTQAFYVVGPESPSL